MKLRINQELLLLIAGLVFFLIIGIAVDRPLILVMAGLSAYLLWNLYNLQCLVKWLSKPGKNIPETIGIWDEIYYQLYHLYQRQRKAKKKLTAIVARFQESTQALPYATIVLNRNMEIEWFNNAAENLFNLSKTHDSGQRIDNLIRVPVFYKFLSKADFSTELEFDYNDRHIRLVVTPYGNNQYLLGAHDVTQRKKLEVMRRDFTANASHELRTPLTVISGYIEAMYENLDETMKVPFNRIREQTERMQAILDDLISLSRYETEELPDLDEHIDLEVLMQDVYKNIIDYDNGRHQINLENIPTVISGSRDEIHTALMNLLTNAVRYSADGTEIVIVTEVSEKEVCISVRDQGIGIPQEHIARLTERFYRVDPGRSREQGGTGLGLAIVKHILDRHYGHLEIESQPGYGSTFRCCFPAVQDKGSTDS